VWGSWRARDSWSWGSAGRCCAPLGSPWDLRKAFDYLAYPELDFKIRSGPSATAMTGYRVRLAEMVESVRIIEQALDGFARGSLHRRRSQVRAATPLRAADLDGVAEFTTSKLVTEGYRVGPGEAYYAIESPRGELGCFVLADGSAKPARVHFRDPSFVNLQAFRDMSIGGYVADMIASLGMLDPILGGVDR